MKSIFVYKQIGGKGFITLFFLLLCTSCEEHSSYFYVPEEFKQFGLFQKGSYWIYQDSATLNRDTCSLLYTNSPDFNQVNNNSWRESYSFDYSGTFFTDAYITTEFYELGLSSHYYLKPIIPGDFIIGLTKEDFSFAQENLALLDSLSIGNNVFKEVYVTKNMSTHTTVADSLKVTFIIYSVKHVGIVKLRQITQDEVVTWDLIDYNAIQ